MRTCLKVAWLLASFCEAASIVLGAPIQQFVLAGHSVNNMVDYVKSEAITRFPNETGPNDVPDEPTPIRLERSSGGDAREQRDGVSTASLAAIVLVWSGAVWLLLQIAAVQVKQERSRRLPQ